MHKEEKSECFLSSQKLALTQSQRAELERDKSIRTKDVNYLPDGRTISIHRYTEFSMKKTIQLIQTQKVC